MTELSEARKSELMQIGKEVLEEVGKEMLDGLDGEAYLAVVTPWWNDAYDAAKKSALEIMDEEIAYAEKVNDPGSKAVLEVVRKVLEKKL